MMINDVLAADFTLKACTIFFVLAILNFLWPVLLRDVHAGFVWGAQGLPDADLSVKDGYCNSFLAASQSATGAARGKFHHCTLHRDIFEAHACGPQAAVRETAATFF